MQVLKEVDTRWIDLIDWLNLLLKTYHLPIRSDLVLPVVFLNSSLTALTQLLLVARQLFEDLLQFDKVQIFENLSKDEIEEKLMELHQISKEFE